MPSATLPRVLIFAKAITGSDLYDDQLRGLIENSNRVFETTAARDRELQETFIALPTFERESRQTIARLDQFARETDPLVTQLRPAARELSPTLIELGALAPDLESFFQESNALIDASKAGFPAADPAMIDLADRRDLRRSPGQEHLVGDVQLVARDRCLADLDAECPSRF